MTGTNLAPAATVTVGGVECVLKAPATATQVTCIAAKQAAAGPQAVVVTLSSVASAPANVEYLGAWAGQTKPHIYGRPRFCLVPAASGFWTHLGLDWF